MSRGLPSVLGHSSRRRDGTGVGPTGLVVTRNGSADDSDEDVEAGRERLGFDRLRANGLTREEIAAIRIYFSRQVDRFIEQRNRLRAEMGEDGNSSADNDSENTSDEDDNSGENSGEGGSDPAQRERERRLRMEDEWMNAQGPNSEFRLNLNSSSPLMIPGRSALFSRQDGSDGMSFAMMRSASMVGSDRDFLWGFILGFCMGFIMLFWVWMPTTPHKQKLGILTGISFQLAFSLLRTGSSTSIDE